jgi:hypothetical protein
MHALKSLLQLAAVLAMTATSTMGLANAAERAAAGECGEYKYYQRGHCVDAREKPGKDWSARVMN